MFSASLNKTFPSFLPYLYTLVYIRMRTPHQPVTWLLSSTGRLSIQHSINRGTRVLANFFTSYSPSPDDAAPGLLPVTRFLSELEGRKEMFYLTTHLTHFIYGYMASDIWLVRKETRCRHIGYSFRLTARVLLYAPSHRQESTYHGLCYTSRGALAGMRNSSMGSPHEGSIRRPIAP